MNGDGPAHLLPLLGRDAELADIKGALDALISERRGGLVSILGPPGAGKSRLLRAAREGAPATGSAWHQTKCLPYASTWPYWPVSELARQLPATPVNDPFVARLFDLPAGDLIGDIDGESFRRGLHRGLAEWIATQSHDRPLVFAVEDVQWADWASLASLGELVRLADRLPVVVVLTSRPEGRFRVGRLSESLTPEGQCNVKLSGFDRATTGQLLTLLLGGEPSGGLLDAVVERSGGNPLFIEQVGRAVRHCPTFAVPDALDDLIAARIDLLPVSTARVLATASVIGRIFSLAAVDAVMAGDVADLDADIDRLLTGAFLEPTPTSQSTDRVWRPGVTFHHAAIAEVAYRRLSPTERRDIHRRVVAGAERLNAVAGDTIDAIARQADLGQTGAAAIDYATTAAARAQRLGVTDRAICQLRRAIEIAPNHPSTTSRVSALRLDIARLEYDRGRYEEAVALYQEVLANGGDHDVATRGLAATLRAKGESERALDLLDSAGPNTASTWLERGRALIEIGRFDEGRRALETGLKAAGGPNGESPVTASLLLDLATAETAEHRVGEALDHGLAAADVLERIGDLRGLALALTVVVNLYRALGRADEAAVAARRATALAERTGLAEEGPAGPERRPIARTAC